MDENNFYLKETWMTPTFLRKHYFHQSDFCLARILCINIISTVEECFAQFNFCYVNETLFS